jgi:hypothetical protein
MLLIIIGILLGLSIILGVMQSKLITNINQIKEEKKSVNVDFVGNAVLDYLTFSVKDIWCIGQNWTKENCSETSFASSGSIRRMLLSPQALRTLGELYLVPGPGSTINPDEWPECAKTGTLATIPIPTERSNWFYEWEKCIAIGNGKYIPNITQDLDLLNLPDAHPLKPLFTNNDIPTEYKYTRAVITLSQADPKIFPSLGRDIHLVLSVEFYGDVNGTNTLIKTIKADFSANPVELNHYGLVLAGQMIMDDSANNPTLMGANIPLKDLIHINSSSYEKDPQVTGIHFDSPVFINGGLVLPAKNSHKFAYVEFKSELYLGMGTVLQGGTVFQSDVLNSKLDTYMLGLNRGAQVIGEDPGLNYIAGPALTKSDGSAGATDGNQRLGNLMHQCVQVNAAKTDFSKTAGSGLFIECIADPCDESTNEYLLAWGSNTVPLTALTLENLNHFESPRPNTLSGSESQCYSVNPSSTSIPTPILAQVYSSSTSGNTAGLPDFKLYPVSSSTEISNADVRSSIAKSARSLFDTATTNALGYCPQNASRLQLDALGDEYAERASVIMNVEYSIRVQDKNNDAQNITNLYNAIGADDRNNMGIATQITNLTNKINSLFPTPTPNPSSPGPSVAYGVKALMGFNTKLASAYLSDELIVNVIPHVDKINTDASTIYNKMLAQIDVLYTAIGNIIGITGQTAIDTEITRLRNEKSTLEGEIQILDTDIATQNAISCTRQGADNVTPASTDPLTGVVTPEVRTATYYEDSTCVNARAAEITRLNNLKTPKVTQLTIVDGKLNLSQPYLDRMVPINNYLAFNDLIAPDLKELSDQRIEVREYTNGLEANVSTGTHVFHPSIAELHIQKPSKTNRYLKEFRFLLNAFDPSFVYNFNTSTPEVNCLDADDGSLVRAWVKTPGSTTKSCVEFKSRSEIV